MVSGIGKWNEIAINLGLFLDPDMLQPTNRKTKTFTEILEEKARSGARISYNLQKYIGTEDDEANGLFVVNQQQHDGL